MNACLSFLVLVSLTVAGGISAETLSRAHRPTGISQQQFHDNCLARQGRYGVLRGEVTCVLSPAAQVICAFEVTLGNCLWTGPMQPGALLAILGGPAAGEPA